MKLTEILDGNIGKRFIHQPRAIVNLAPSTGVKYPLIASEKNVRIIAYYAKVTWTVQPNPLEVHLTIDGVTYIFAQANPVSTTIYYANVLHPALADNAQLLGAALIQTPFIAEGRNVTIEAETTGGTVSNLKAELLWAKVP